MFFNPQSVIFCAWRVVVTDVMWMIPCFTRRMKENEEFALKLLPVKRSGNTSSGSTEWSCVSSKLVTYWLYESQDKNTGSILMSLLICCRYNYLFVENDRNNTKNIKEWKITLGGSKSPRVGWISPHVTTTVVAITIKIIFCKFRS